MEVLGQRIRRLIARRSAPLAATVVALATVASCAWCWPFAIDDAWIEVRYARHLAEGAGYVWNVAGPSTDGVTPLPWTFLLAPLAHGSPLEVLVRAKLLGALSWTLTAAAWGAAVVRARAPVWAKVMAIVLLAFDVPVSAHATSGMETAVATAIVTASALSFRRPFVAAALAGLAATLRPELVVWGVAWSAGLTIPGRDRLRTIAAGLVALVPFLLCALIRLVAFGRPGPLALLAKPSDLAHGLVYASATFLVALAPLALAAPSALRRERGPALAIASASSLHVVVIVAVGGDWMPYARLIAPIVPAMLYAFVLAAPFMRARLAQIRVVAALAMAAYVWPTSMKALREAGKARAELIERAPPLLVTARRIATVDIGWPSAVSEATIIDLAGVTDPEVATLPGGHTSKRIDASLLLARDPDLVLFYTDLVPDALDALTYRDFPRVVEARLFQSDLFRSHFVASAFLPLGENGAGYVVFTRSVS